MPEKSYYEQESEILAKLHARILEKMEAQRWEPCVTEDGCCVYFVPGSEKSCAVGCLFSREFAEKLENSFGPVNSWSEARVTEVMEELGIPLEKMSPGRLRYFLDAMQRAHDTSSAGGGPDGSLHLKKKLTEPRILRLFSTEHEDRG